MYSGEVMAIKPSPPLNQVRNKTNLQYKNKKLHFINLSELVT